MANANATKDEKNKIKGIDTHPNQKPIADKSFASPKPMPSLFFNFSYPKIIIHMTPYPIAPPIRELCNSGIDIDLSLDQMILKNLYPLMERSVHLEL